MKSIGLRKMRQMNVGAFLTQLEAFAHAEGQRIGQKIQENNNLHGDVDEIAEDQRTTLDDSLVELLSNGHEILESPHNILEALSVLLALTEKELREIALQELTYRASDELLASWFEEISVDVPKLKEELTQNSVPYQSHIAALVVLVALGMQVRIFSHCPNEPTNSPMLLVPPECDELDNMNFPEFHIFFHQSEPSAFYPIVQILGDLPSFNNKEKSEYNLKEADPFLRLSSKKKAKASAKEKEEEEEKEQEQDDKEDHDGKPSHSENGQQIDQELPELEANVMIEVPVAETCVTCSRTITARVKKCWLCGQTYHNSERCKPFYSGPSNGGWKCRNDDPHRKCE